MNERLQHLTAAVWLLLTSVATADTITMRAKAHVTPDAKDVRLSDVADLDGPRAEALADLVVVPIDAAQNELTLTVAQVRQALDQAEVHWGKVHLSGRATALQRRHDSAAPPPQAMSAVSLSAMQIEPESVWTAPESQLEGGPGTEAEHELELGVAGFIDEPTLRGEVVRLIARELGLTPDALQVLFSDRDATTLQIPTSTYRFEIEPLGNLTGERVEISVRGWRDGKIDKRWILSTIIHIRAEVLRPVREIPRGQTMSEGDVEGQLEWLAPPAAASVLRREELSGLVTTVRVKAGEPLTRSHLAAPVLVKRGDPVMVRCIVGGLVLSLKAEARTEGVEGQAIEVRKLGERQTFLATVTGAGEAVVEVGRN